MHVVRSLLAATLIATSCPAAAAPPPTWQGLVLVKSKKMDVVYLLPNADFRSYTQIMYDPVQIAFQKGLAAELQRPGHRPVRPH